MPKLKISLAIAVSGLIACNQMGKVEVKLSGRHSASWCKNNEAIDIPKLFFSSQDDQYVLRSKQLDAGPIYIFSDASCSKSKSATSDLIKGIVLSDDLHASELFLGCPNAPKKKCIKTGLRLIKSEIEVEASQHDLTATTRPVQVRVTPGAKLNLFSGTGCQKTQLLTAFDKSTDYSLNIAVGVVSDFSYQITFADSTTTSCKSLTQKFLHIAFTYYQGANVAPFGDHFGSLRDESETGNLPPPRSSPAAFLDNDRNIIILGGNSLNDWGDRNDMWKFNTSLNRWTWIGGTQSIGANGNYGTIGVSNASNMIGGNAAHVMWQAKDQRVWVFGGYGRDSAHNKGALNDIWVYDPQTFLWTWVKGSGERNTAGVDGPLGTAGSSYRPGGRFVLSHFQDKDGNLWIYGGEGTGSTSTYSRYTDFWKWNPSTEQWSFEGGSTLPNVSPVYGTRGERSAAVTPGEKGSLMSWYDADEHVFWIFGGQSTGGALHNSLWKYDFNAREWTWLHGSNSTDAAGTYTGLEATPGARRMSVSWIDSKKRLWLLGGEGIDSQGTSGLLNDLWYFDTAKHTWHFVRGSMLANPSRTVDAAALLAPSEAHMIQGLKDGISVADPNSQKVFILFGHGYSGTGSTKLNHVWSLPLE